MNEPLPRPQNQLPQGQDFGRVAIFLGAIVALLIGAYFMFGRNSVAPNANNSGVGIPGNTGGNAVAATNTVQNPDPNMLSVTPTNGLTGDAPPPPPPAPTTIVSPTGPVVRQFPARSFWVKTENLKVRSAPGVTSSELPNLQLGFGQEIVANAEITIQTKDGPSTWLRVNTGSGIGYVNKKYAGTTPLSASAPPPPSTGTSMTQDNAAANTSEFNAALRRAPMGFYVQAGAATNSNEIPQLEIRTENAVDCVGQQPRVYASDAFVKTKRAGMVLLAYGPFNTRNQASNFAARLRPCISDTFINEQPY